MNVDWRSIRRKITSDRNTTIENNDNIAGSVFRLFKQHPAECTLLISSSMTTASLCKWFDTTSVVKSTAAVLAPRATPSRALSHPHSEETPEEKRDGSVGGKGGKGAHTDIYLAIEKHRVDPRYLRGCCHCTAASQLDVPHCDSGY
jgi:hypothetical protein